jgi:flagellar protein FlaG
VGGDGRETVIARRNSIEARIMSNDIARVANLPAAAIAADTARAKGATPTSTATPESQPQQQQAPVVSAPSDVTQAVQRIQSYLKSVNHALEFRIDSDSGRTVVSVRDVATGDLIRQFPSEEVLRLAQLAEEQNLALLSETV